jgi:hypothetical protein
MTTTAQEIAALKDEIAASKARLAALEARQQSPPPPPPMPTQRFDPTERMRMPPSAEQAMVNCVPDHRQVAMRDCRAPTGPSSQGIIPSSQLVSSTRLGTNTGGWAREIPLTNPPGVAYADRLMDAQDARDRHDLMMKEAQRLARQRLAEGK